MIEWAFDEVTALWSLAVLLASVFAIVLVCVNLPPKKNKWISLIIWLAVIVIGYLISFAAYAYDISNDFVGIIGVTGLVCLGTFFACEGTWSSKIFVSLTMSLIANVVTFMFCGTTDSFLAPALGFLEEIVGPDGEVGLTPYGVRNILLFICIKLIVYTIIYILYVRHLKKSVKGMISDLNGNLKIFIWAPLVSVVGFYFINMVTNTMGIFPGTVWFFVIYITICAIFVVEFWLIFYSVRTNARAAKTEAELNVAKNIQQSMLPMIFPAFPDRDDFDIYATMDPAKEVGGDFYDFFFVDETHFAVVVADVSGKGVPAALFMAIGKTLLKDHTSPGVDLGTVFADVNNMLCQTNSEQLFITAYEAIIDLETGDVEYVNAGHEHPFIMRKQKDGSYKYEEMMINAGFVLAGMEGIPYKSSTFHMEPGDKLVQYSDGVTESTDSRNELYGIERLSKFLNENKELSPSELLPALRKDVDAFVGNAPQFDDITMLCFEYKANRQIV